MLRIRAKHKQKNKIKMENDVWIKFNIRMSFTLKIS